MNHCYMSDIATYGASTRPAIYHDPKLIKLQPPTDIPPISDHPEIIKTTETAPPGRITILDRFEIKELIGIGLVLSALALLKR